MQYNRELSNHSKVYFVHVSQDANAESAATWAKKESFPWLTVLPQDVKTSGLEKYRGNQAIPFFALVSANGQVIESGNSSTEIFTKVRSL